MKKNLTALMCALILTGFATLAAAEPASPIPSAQPSPAVASAPVAQLDFLSQGACTQTLAGIGVPVPTPMAGCAGGEGGPCNTNMDCKGYVCHNGEPRWCYYSTGSGCNGWCGCW
jgi:hypothetical protein